jgi:HD-GYP domain-containing protein (c-di-GMP phosphodiesterase class II)
MKKVFVFILLLILTGALFASDDVARQFLDKANKYYLVKEYDKAAIHINFLFKLYSDDQMPEEAISLANLIYFDYIKSISAAKNYTKLDEIEIFIMTHSVIFEEKIKTILKQTRKHLEDEKIKVQKEQERIEKLAEEAKILVQKEQERKDKKEEELKKMQAEYDLRKQEKEEFIKMQEKLLIESRRQEEASRSEMNQLINRIIESQKPSQDKDFLSQYLPVIIISIISFIFLTSFVFILFIFMRHMKKEQITLDYTLRNLIQLPEYQLIDNENKKKLTHLTPLQPPVSTAQESLSKDENHSSLPSAQNQFERMFDLCRNYGEQIDKLTHRKNTSRNVGELVYKISKFMNYDEHEAMLHYMVGLVHDIGFLNLDSNLFQLKTLTEDQFKLVQSHVSEGLKMIGFIPEENKSLFIDGISKHHENLDGSGYPEKISGDQIPYIAKVIRVVESYIALISMRAYRNVITREEAVDILRKELDKYDVQIVNALDNII